MNSSTRNPTPSHAISWTLLLMALVMFLSACTSTAAVNTFEETIIVTPVQPTPAPSPKSSETPEVKPDINLRQEERPQATKSAATNTPQPTATMTIEATPSLEGNAMNSMREIPLVGPAASSEAELSGLAWYSDYLIILPQFPDFDTDEGDGFIFALPKEDVIAFLDGETSRSLEPRPIPFVAPGLGDSLVGFEGYEAIAFLGDDVYVTIEAETGEGMLGYLAKGAMAPDLSALILDTSALATIVPQVDAENMSEESLFATDQMVGTIYELNGRAVNASPVVHLFDLDLKPIEPVSFPNVEFRITDVSELDNDGRFWAINYFFPGAGGLIAALGPQEEGDDSERIRLPWEGLGRLVELQYTSSGITLTDTAPIQLESLLSNAHNWEGLARLDDRGFLIVSDEIPDTVFGFVPLPQSE